MSVANATYTRSNSLAASEARNYPRFFIETVRDEHSSRHHGREIFREEERVEIIMPGNPYTRPVQRVTKAHRDKWEKEYAAFKAGIELSADGTPLEEWPRLKRSQVLELKALNCATVEHVAAMDDQAIQRVGLGGRQLRELAKAFLDDAANAAEVERLADDNAKKEAELERLNRQVAALNDRLAVLQVALQAKEIAPAPATDAAGADAEKSAPSPPVLRPISSLDDLASMPVASKKPRGLLLLQSKPQTAGADGEATSVQPVSLPARDDTSPRLRGEHRRP